MMLPPIRVLMNSAQTSQLSDDTWPLAAIPIHPHANSLGVLSRM